MTIAPDNDVLAAEYVLGTLGPDERAETQALIAVDPAFAEIVRGWERRLGELSAMVDPVDPPADMWERIRAGVAVSNQSMKRPEPEFDAVDLDADARASKPEASQPAMTASAAETSRATEMSRPTEAVAATEPPSATDAAASAAADTAAVAATSTAADETTAKPAPPAAMIVPPVAPAAPPPAAKPAALTASNTPVSPTQSSTSGASSAAAASAPSPASPPSPAPAASPMPHATDLLWPPGTLPPPSTPHLKDAARVPVSGPPSGGQPDAEIIDLTARLQRWRSAALVSGALAASFLAVVVVQETRPDLLPGALRPKERLVEVTKSVEVPSPRPAEYVAVLQADAASPAFLLTFDLDKRTLTVRTVGAQQQAGKSYELWLVSDKFQGPRSLGVIGSGPYTVQPADAQYDAVVLNRATYAVSLEPEGGSPTGAPTGPVVYSGRLVQATAPDFPARMP